MEMSSTDSARGIAIRRRTGHTCFSVLVFALMLIRSLAAFADSTPVNSGGTPEAFAQLVSYNIVPSAGATPSVTASAVMSIDSSWSCVTAIPPFKGTPAFSPAFVSGDLSLDANALPTQFTYFGSSPYTASPGYAFNYLEVATLNVSCSVTPSGSSASSYNFKVPIYLCTSGRGFPSQPAIGLSTSGCEVTEVPSGCTVSSAGTVDPNGYSRNTTTENLQVYMPSPSGNLPPEQTPAIAVDIQLLYNGFSLAFSEGLKGFSPYLVRVACSSLSTFTNQ